ncbi:MAG: M81 family metallopeptidase, partial [SAR324 cluster bacterium]|nr:M81 family metallopeptidase [SAR324 cluster bacterium]
FAPVTTREDFTSCCYLVGEEITLEAAQPNPAMPMEMAAFIAAMNGAGAWQPLPILLAGAEPGGAAEQSFLTDCLAEMERRLEAVKPVDAVYISNHGAMVSTTSLDPDGDMFRMVREAVGPGVPIVATLDLHANVSREMTRQVDVLIAYLKNPHTDQEERGVEAAGTLRELLGGVRAHTAFLPLPLTPITTTLLTAQGPYAELIDYGQEHLSPDILNVSILGGFAYGDTPKQGLSVIVTGRNSLQAAQGLAKEIAGRAWENRRRFEKDYTPLQDAIALAKRAGEDHALPAIILADIADNPGGGARSNTIWLLQGLHEAGVSGVLMGNFFDPALANKAHELGEGAEFVAEFNSEETQRFSERLRLPVKVLKLNDGPLVGKRGIYAGRTLTLGRCAALQVGGIGLLVSSRRKQCADPVFFEHVGLDAATARTVVLKSRGHFRAGFDLLFSPERIYEVDTPGLTSTNLKELPYQHFQRNSYQFDPGISWQPPEWVRK